MHRGPEDKYNIDFVECYRGGIGHYSNQFHVKPDGYMTLKCAEHNTRYDCTLHLKTTSTAADHRADKPNEPKISYGTDEIKTIGMPGFIFAQITRAPRHGNVKRETWQSDGRR